jgi:hypothetical protein
MLNVPAGHIADAGLDAVEPVGHAYPASHIPHADEPLVLNEPAAHSDTVAFVAPATGQM